MDQGVGDKHDYRSRLVAHEIQQNDDYPMFASTLPFERIGAILLLKAADIESVVSHDGNHTCAKRT